MYDVEREMALEPMQGNQTSSPVDLGYTELFHLPALTAVSFYMCDSVRGDFLEFHQANEGSLRV